MLDVGVLVPVTDAGYQAPRFADFLSTFRSAFESKLTALGLASSVSWDDRNALSVVSVCVAEVAAVLGEEVQALADARIRNNAAGVLLDDLGAAIGVTRNAATPGSVVLTLTGTNGPLIPAGSEVRGADSPNGDTLWTTDEAVTISGGTGSTRATCASTGRITAAVGVVDAIVSPIAGWSAVTNAAAATPGTDDETDAAYRTRQATSLATSGGWSTSAIRSALLALDYVTAAVVLENDTAVTATVSGVPLPPHSVRVIVYPDTLSAAQIDEVAAALYDAVAPGVYVSGSDEIVTVQGADSTSKVVRWDYATALTVDVEVTVDLADGYDVADVTDDVETAVDTYFDTLTVGSPVRRLALAKLLADVAGVVGAVIELNGTGADVVPALDEVPTLGTTSVLD